jgi:streptogramin lyase
MNPQSQFSFFPFSSLNADVESIAVRGTNEIWVGLWGNPGASDYILHLDGSTGAVVGSFPMTQNTGSVGMTAGPDGNIWFVEYNAPGVGRITPTGQITHFLLPSNVPMNPVAIAAGPDGALWFGGGASDAMVRITTAGVMTFFSAGDIIDAIVSGPDGNLWYTGYNGTLGRMTTAGVDTVYHFPGQNPYGLAFGNDGNAWFTDDNASTITRFKLH